MKTIKIVDSIYSVGVVDKDIKNFDVFVPLSHGTTYNSYLLLIDNHVTLIDGVKKEFSEQWLENISSLVSLDQIRYLIVQHSEPDHSGSIEALLKLNPHIIVYGSFLAIANLKQILNFAFNAVVIKEGSSLDLNEISLDFILTPNVHWPDTILTYEKISRTLFTCDFLSAHYATPTLKLSTIRNREYYDYATKYYFDVIMSPFKKDVKNALLKISNFKIERVLNSHGPIIDLKEDVDRLIRQYYSWSFIKRRYRPKVVICYLSSYGYTKKLALEIERQINKEEVDIVLYDLMIPTRDLVLDLENCDGLMIGSPTFVADALTPCYDALNLLNPWTGLNKHFTAFGSYGWSGEAVGNLLTRAKQLRMKVSDSGFRVRMNPSEEDLIEVRKYAKEFIETIKKDIKI